MDLLQEIRKSGKKSKELNAFMAKLITEKKPSSKDFADALVSGNDAERGTCIEALEYASQNKPEIAREYISCVVDFLNDKAPRVKWEAARVIGNIASKYPEEVSKAVESLLTNTNDKGTVVRWSTAFALGEIARYNLKLRENLLSKINTILKKESNNGVKNVYLKTLKALGAK